MITYLTEYSHFTNKQDLDVANRQHVLAHRDAMNTTEKAFLDMIRCYPIKFGAAHFKHEKIEKAIKKSIVTVRRAIRRLE